MLVKKNRVYLYNFIFYVKSYISFFKFFILGFYKNYFHFLKLKGIGYKIILFSLNIIIKLGFSHRILFLLKKDLKVQYINKQLLKIESRYLNIVKNTIFMFINIRKINLYKKKGFFFKSPIIKIKISNKKSKV